MPGWRLEWHGGCLLAMADQAASPSFAFWFIALTLVTFFGAVGALAQGLGVFITLAVLTTGSSEDPGLAASTVTAAPAAEVASA